MTTTLELNAHWLINNFNKVKLKDCGGNGDCFYLSLIYYLKLDLKPIELRQQIIQYINDYKTDYLKYFKNETELNNEIKTIKKKWADHFSISVITNLYKLNICIIYKYNDLYKYHTITYNSTIDNNAYLYYEGEKYTGNNFEFGTGHYKAIDDFNETIVEFYINPTPEPEPEPEINNELELSINEILNTNKERRNLEENIKILENKYGKIEDIKKKIKELYSIINTEKNSINIIKEKFNELAELERVIYRLEFYIKEVNYINIQIITI